MTTVLKVAFLSTASNALLVATAHQALVAAQRTRSRRSRAFRRPRARSVPSRPVFSAHRPSQTLYPLQKQYLPNPLPFATAATPTRPLSPNLQSSASNRPHISCNEASAVVAHLTTPKLHPQASMADSRAAPGKQPENLIDFESSVSSVRTSVDSTRPSRSSSNTSRNRLSLTLPIAPPTSYPTRPTPTSTIQTSFPPTPVETSGLTTPADASDLIIAIAAQERKVLELRDELRNAEQQLRVLRKQFERAGPRNAAALRSLSAAASETNSNSGDDAIAQNRSMELDRRKALLSLCQQAPAAPRDSKRRVFRSGHARTLSLLSPAKSTSGFSDLDQHLESPVQSASSAVPAAQRPRIHHRHHASVSQKRATWSIDARHGANGVRQFAEDFKTGLWTFVEDLRQVTVGEEAVNGQAVRSPDDPTPRPKKPTRLVDVDSQDTIRPSGSTRANTAGLFDEPAGDKKESENSETRPKIAGADSKTKRFSWNPLTMDDLNDDDWSSWDSPTMVPSSRWSGSTATGDLLTGSLEKNRDMETPSKKPTASRNSLQFLADGKLEELSWQAINKLSPSNLKRTANDLMDQWEKSLSTPNPAEDPLAYNDARV